MKCPSVDRVREVLSYNEETGELIWKERNKYTQHLLGKTAGCRDRKGYIKIMIDSYQTYGHIVAWVITYGRWPDNEIDHIDQNPGKNNIANLREAGPAINQRNREISYKNQTGYVGVSYAISSSPKGRPYKATGTVQGKNTHLGYFKTAKEAAAARKEWVKANPQLGFLETV